MRIEARRENGKVLVGWLPITAELYFRSSVDYAVYGKRTVKRLSIPVVEVWEGRCEFARKWRSLNVTGITKRTLRRIRGFKEFQ